MPVPLWLLLAGAGLAALPFDGPVKKPVDICPPAKLEEPSGVAWHPARKTIFAVGDEGDLVELDASGKVVGGPAHLGGDLEGVTVGPAGRVYVAVENPPAILVVDPEKMAVLRRHPVATSLDGKQVLCLRFDGGIEGLCYVPEKDAFFAVNQLAPARLVELDVPRDGAADGAPARVKRVVAEIDDPVKCASDLVWDAASGHFLIPSSNYEGRPGKLFELDADGKVLRELPLPGEHQEGFCVDPEGRAYVACDSGGILRVDPAPEAAK